MVVPQIKSKAVRRGILALVGVLVITLGELFSNLVSNGGTFSVVVLGSAIVTAFARWFAFEFQSSYTEAVDIIDSAPAKPSVLAVEPSQQQPSVSASTQVSPSASEQPQSSPEQTAVSGQ